MSRRSSLILRSTDRLSSQVLGRRFVRNQRQQAYLTSPASNCLCRHFTTPAIPSPLQPPPPFHHLPAAPAYRSPVHFIPPAYQPPFVSAAPFTFVLLYRHPPHYEAEDDPQYANKPLQYLLKLGQPSAQHASGRVVWEVLLYGDLTVAELERVMVSNMHWLASVQLAVKGQAVPQSAAIQSLYGKSDISLVVHPHHASAYSVSINGGLPLTRGILSYLARHRIVYLSAVLLVIALIMQQKEDKPIRDADGREESVEDGQARQYWQQMVKTADDKMRDSLFSKPDEPSKK